MMAERQMIECASAQDMETLAVILVKNGYSVRIRRIKKESGSAYRWYVEYWRE